MAAVFDIDDHRGDDDDDRDGDVDVAFGLIVDHIRGLSPRSAVGRVRRYQGRLAALEAELLGEHVTADGDTRRAERLLGDGKTSRREQRRRAKRAEAVAANPALGDKMATGEMSGEQVDVIADAAAKTDGAAAVDEDLIDQVAAVDPDQGTKLADDWRARRASADGTQTEHDRQRALRRIANYTNKAGLDAITIEGDGISIKNMRDAIAERSDLLYTLDGGRDLPSSRHTRSKTQRNFDAAHELLCNVTAHADGTTTGHARTTAAAARDGADGTRRETGSRRTTAAKPEPRCECRGAKPSGNRPKIVIGLHLDKATGANPDLVAEQIGHGPIPDSILAEYINSGDLLGAVFGADGGLLWLGRTARIASKQQLLALIVRDKACVLCTAPHTQCEAHHLMPWSAPGHGPTNLNNLALICRNCHRNLHANNQTLYQDPRTRHWHTRAATPHETPPSRPPPPPQPQPPQRE